MLGNELDAKGGKGTIIFTNASAALKGFPSSGAFAMACHAKSGLAQSMARELMPQGINVPIDSAIGWMQEDGTRAHRLAGTTVDDNMADPDCIAETYLQLHRQHTGSIAPPRYGLGIATSPSNAGDLRSQHYIATSITQEFAVLF
jgi:NAD(P)-dependent dehydrogenase (short-subunit alcohol dehydrogenase family)